MRLIFGLALFLTTATLARTQPPPKELDRTPQPRFGIPVKQKAYPQDTAQKALASAVEASKRATPLTSSRTCSIPDSSSCA